MNIRFSWGNELSNTYISVIIISSPNKGCAADMEVRVKGSIAHKDRGIATESVDEPPVCVRGGGVDWWDIVETLCSWEWWDMLSFAIISCQLHHPVVVYADGSSLGSLWWPDAIGVIPEVGVTTYVTSSCSAAP